ncbi:MAG: D-xylose transport system substrate-binding protein [Clostridiales bacterium]|jgi:D-xylose transport system substrate-binding protein|nr:D-xylose transport system substrate-binding protein [Clostridiales bacterium]MDN5297846.1 D-xylose transport system substrate-binding protein [Clostridiales bacterium]
MKKYGLAMVLCLLLLLIGIGSSQRQHNSEDQQIIIGISFDSFVVERWQRELEILMAEAEERGYAVRVEIANEDLEKQTAQIKKLIKERVDVLVVVPNDVVALADVINEAKDAGIKVIAYDRLMKQSEIDLYLSFDNIGIGEQMAVTLMAALENREPRSVANEADSSNDSAMMQDFGTPKQPYRLLIVNGDPKDNNSAMLNTGFYNVLTPYIANGSVEIIDEVWASEWREKYAITAVEKWINRGEVFDGVICGNDVLAGGAVEMLSKWRLAGDVLVVGQDAELSACQRVVEGSQLATIYKPISRLAVACIDGVDLLMNNQMARWQGDTIYNGFSNIPFIKLSTNVVVKETIDEIVIESGFHTREDVYRNLLE